MPPEPPRLGAQQSSEIFSAVAAYFASGLPSTCKREIPEPLQCLCCDQDEAGALNSAGGARSCSVLRPPDPRRPQGATSCRSRNLSPLTQLPFTQAIVGVALSHARGLRQSGAQTIREYAGWPTTRFALWWLTTTNATAS